MDKDATRTGSDALNISDKQDGKNPAAENGSDKPLGKPMTINDLPAPGTHRWITRRKAEVVAGVRSGLISLEEACRRYSLSVEEFLSWQTTLDRHGLNGLRVTRLQDLRPTRG